VIMGDVGALPLGGAIAAVAIMTKQEMLLAIVGGLFVVESLSVIVQVLSFKTRGKRVFRMAPLHHHFELSGWPESRVVIRFWSLAEREAEGKNRWVAVTGTNGKSTTTAWIAEILRRAGRPVALAGNIGVPLSAFLSERTARDFVCEVSSFQLEAIDRFAPHVA